MRPTDARGADVNDAAWEGTRGAVTGAVRYGVISAALGGVGWVVSPMYRGLTVQFKVFLQMSGMIMGSVIEADSRIRHYEDRMRIQRRLAKDRAARENFERELEEDDGPLPQPPDARK
ncbi:hypothetical protein GGR56DRAFT_93637 [Xylariaceae sp. FL0804]|nr:hypothetical protein GGR56DRAFT_93637 [Xylariaceae sp. FL0804]